MKRYPKYKDSGIDWLGEIPEHWLNCKLRRIAQITYGLTLELDRTETKGTFIISLPNVTKEGKLLLDDVPLTPLNDEEKKVLLLNKGDLLFNWRNGSTNHIGKTAYFDADGEYTHVSFLLRLRFNLNKYDSRYYYFLLNHLRNIKFFSAAKLRVNNTYNQAELKQLEVVLPPPDEQKTIACFIDRKLVQIDQFISNKQRFIELLKEQKSAIVNRAVTKGLNPDAPMKPSGIEWLGDIPAHWEVKRLKYLVPQITVGIVVTPAKYYVETGIPCLRSLNISSGQINSSELVFISPESNELHQKSKIFTEDVVVVRTGQTGTAAIVTEEYHGANCIDLLIIRRSQKLLTRYLYFYINSYATTCQVSSNSVGAIQAHYNTSTLSELLVIFPPKEEQKTIIAFIDTEVAKINQAITKAEKEIELIQEYRTTLISDAVTGKIDVRELTHNS